MMKKIFKYIVMITMIIMILMLTLAFRKVKVDSNKKIIENENKTIEEQITEVMTINEKDENVIGYLTIKEIGLENAPIAEGTDNNVIDNYIGHFENTAYLDGNVCLCSHNRGSKAAYFGKLKDLNKGDEIIYITKYETKKYEVKEIKEIEETDLSVLNSTEENQITLITCVKNKKNLRLCVIGIEKGE